MRRTGTVLALAFALVAASAFAQSGDAKPRPLLVGVVDMGAAFEKYERKNDLEKMVNAEKEGIDAKVKKSQADLEALRTKLQGLTPGSDEFFDTDNEYKLRANVLKASMDGIEAQLRHKVEKLTLQVLGEINDTIKAFGDKNGYDLILKGDGAASNLEAFQDRMLRAQTTAVLYRGKSMDVTGAIIDALNNPEHLKAVRK